MEPLGRRRFQPPRGLNRTQRRDRRIIIRGQLKPEPHGKLLMQEVGLGAGIRQFDRHTAKIAAGQDNVDMIAVSIGVARRKPAMRVRIDGQARQRRHHDAQPQLIMGTQPLRQRERDMDRRPAAAESLDVLYHPVGLERGQGAAQGLGAVAQRILDADLGPGMGFDDGAHQSALPRGSCVSS